VSERTAAADAFNDATLVIGGQLTADQAVEVV
jgi:hypothetical protein